MTYITAAWHVCAFAAIVILAIRAHNRMWGDDEK